MWRALTSQIRRGASAARSFSAGAAEAARSEPLPPEYNFDPALLKLPPTRVTRLSNGIRVATEEGFGETASVGVFIDAGSRYENAQNNGVAHFLEHLSFKGTAKRTRVQLEKEIENLGGHLNAYTSREQTVYYAKSFKQDVAQTVDILADILQNSTLDPHAIEAERDTILREMEEVEKNMEEVIFDRLHETAFRESALGKTILGPVENIQKISRQDLLDYIQTHYTGNRMVVAAAGAVKHEDLVKLVQDKFGGVPEQPRNGQTVRVPPALFTGSEIRERNDDMEQAHVALAFKGVNWQHPDSFTFMVLQSLLGNWDPSAVGGKDATSRLVAGVAEYGMASKVTTFNTHYNDTGLFGLYTVAEPHKLYDLWYHSMYELVRMCYRVTEEEVARARLQLKTQLLLNLDGTSQTCEDIGRQILTYGRRLNPAEISARIDAVDYHAVRKAALQYFHDQEIAVAAIGPVYELPDFNWLRRRTYWLRY